MAFLTRLKKQLMILVLHNRKKQLVYGIFKKQITPQEKKIIRWRAYTQEKGLKWVAVAGYR
jgi:hypothetical protein